MRIYWFLPIAILTDTDFLTNFKKHSYIFCPIFIALINSKYSFQIKIDWFSLWVVPPYIYIKQLDQSVANYSLLYAQGSNQKSYGSILTDTDSNPFLGI